MQQLAHAETQLFVHTAAFMPQLVHIEVHTAARTAIQMANCTTVRASYNYPNSSTASKVFDPPDHIKHEREARG